MVSKSLTTLSRTLRRDKVNDHAIVKPCSPLKKLHVTFDFRCGILDTFYAIGPLRQKIDKQCNYMTGAILQIVGPSLNFGDFL